MIAEILTFLVIAALYAWIKDKLSRKKKDPIEKIFKKYDL